MPVLVRPHLVAPVEASVEVSTANLDGLGMAPGDDRVVATLDPPSTSTGSGRFAGAWVLSSHAVDGSGDTVETIRLDGSGPCSPQPPGTGSPGEELGPCFAEIKRLGYRQQVTYQPSSRFWAFQAYESAIFLALAGLLAGFCFWRLRHRLS
jgi:hypothetical protein